MNVFLDGPITLGAREAATSDLINPCLNVPRFLRTSKFGSWLLVNPIPGPVMMNHADTPAD